MFGELNGLEVGMNDEAVQLRDRYAVRNFHKGCIGTIGRVGPDEARNRTRPLIIVNSQDCLRSGGRVHRRDRTIFEMTGEEL